MRAGEKIEIYLRESPNPYFEVHQKLLGHFAPYWSELFVVIDLKRSNLDHADQKGATWIHEWMEAGGTDKASEDLDPDTAHSSFVDKFISGILAAVDLRLDQAKG